MSAFDNIVRVICPECGGQGTAAWNVATKGSPPGRRELRDLSAGFVAVDANAKASPRILCDNCRVPADEHRS